MINPKLPNIKRYELHQELGKGSFGRVYSAIETQTRAQRAIKVFRTDSDYANQAIATFGSIKEMFENESLVPFSQREQNPNLVPSKVIEIEGEHYLVMPKFDTTLKSFRKKVNEKNFYQIARQIISGLAQLQTLGEAGYFHFDIKPDCILINENKGGLEVAIGDFGTNCPKSKPIPQLGDTKRYSPLALREVFQFSNDINLIGKTLLETLIGAYPGSEIIQPIDRSTKKHITYICNLVEDNLKPTPEYQRLVKANLDALPKFITPEMKELIQAMLFEEIEDGTELLKEFDSRISF